MLKRHSLMVIILAAALGACARAKPFDYDEADKRPGLFTGKEGAFVIYRR